MYVRWSVISWLKSCITQKGVSTLIIPSTVLMRDFGLVQTVELSSLDVFFVNPLLVDSLQLNSPQRLCSFRYLCGA